MKYLYFSAEWCAPCKSLAPIMNQVGQTIEVQKIDVDKQSEVASLYNIRSVPTVILIKAGIEVNRFSGVQSASTYLNALK